MSDTDQMTDSPELGELRHSLSGVAMPVPPRLEAIVARGRVHRRHRRLGVARLSVICALAVTALALVLTGVQRRASTLGTIRTASFTLQKNANGTDTLTINPKEILDPAALQSDLARYGIPAKVTVGSFCSSDPAPAGFAQVWSGQPSGQSTATPQNGVKPTITINPSAVPSGTELSIGDFQLADGGQQANAVLMNTSTYTCTSTPPSLNGSANNSFGLLYGGPGPS